MDNSLFKNTVAWDSCKPQAPLLRPLWMLRGKAPQRGLVALSAYRRGLRPLAGALRNLALMTEAIEPKELFGDSP
jgi:hypothetical protein